MEIEAKFALPNRQAYRAFLRLRDLAGFTLIPTASAHVSDRYFDTEDRRLLAAGYTCRLRTEGASIVATLKSLGGVQGAVHQRDEQEVQLPKWTLEAAEWPASTARDLALKLTGGAALQPLFDLEQQRARADVMDGARRAAELSLDAVRVAVGQRPALYYELEAELKPDGTEADLARLAQALREEYTLAPEPRSKFARALETLRSRGAAVEGPLSAQERSALAGHAAGPDAELARRAAVVLGWADGLPTREIVVRSGLSDGRVRFWVRAFRRERMAIFTQPAEAGEAPARPTGAPPPAQASPKARAGQPKRSEAKPMPPPSTPLRAASPPEAPAAAPRKRHGLPTVAEFCRAHGVDMAHAVYVADRAQYLFDALSRIHGLPRKRRKLLRQAALLCTIGAGNDPERPHRAGRDLILAQPLREVSTGDRLVLAAAIALQRGKPKPEKEPTMDALEPKQRALAVSLAALLHIAEALDFSRSQATRIESLEGATSVHCEILLAGPAAAIDAQRAGARGTWWQQLHKQELVFTAAPAGAAVEAGPTSAAVVAAPPPSAVEIAPMRADEPMSEAGRKAMYTHFLRMLANEAGTRLGEDIEALHDMRVATRRMRAAYRIFEAYFDPKALKPFNKSLRRTGATLGAVRDLDVLLEAAETYQAALPEEAGAALAPLLDDWRARREVARRQLLDYLDSGAYRRFVTDFEVFLATPGAGARPIPPGEPIPYQVCHVAPRLVIERYETVRAYEPVLRDGAPLTSYHMLRIDCKRLRYVLEFFKEVLGPEAAGVIKQVTAMQDVLGALQDAHVAEGLIQAFLDEQHNKRKKAALAPLAGVTRYFEVQRAAQQELLAQFSAPWAELLGADFRRSLALAVAAL